MLPRAPEGLATIGGAAPVKHTAEAMSKRHIDLVVVCGPDGGPDGGMVGKLTKADIVGQIRQCIGSGCIARVDKIMKNRGLQHIPVFDEARNPAWIIYARDALQWVLSGVKSDQSLLRDYVMDAGYQ